MQYIDQFYGKKHTGARSESLNKHRSLASVLLRDEESDALHKINDYIYKDTEYKYFGCLNMSSELFTVCFWADCEGNRSTFHP